MLQMKVTLERNENHTIFKYMKELYFDFDGFF